jgi:PAS domain S-box-containing protein
VQKVVAFFRPPVFPSAGLTRRARMSYTILLALLISAALFPLSYIFLSEYYLGISLAVCLLLALVCLAGMLLVRRKRVRLAGALVSSLLIVLVTLLAVLYEGLRDPVIIGYAVCILTAHLLVDLRWGWLCTIAVCLAALGLFLAEQMGLITLFVPSTLTVLGIVEICLLLMGVMTALVVRMLNDALSQARHSRHILRIQNQRLIESETHYRLLFENNPMPMWIYDLDSLRFLDVNEAAISRYGYSREEFLRMTIKDIRPQEDIQALLKNIAQAPAEGLDSSDDWRHIKKNGELIYVQIISHSILFEGRQARLVLANDVTARNLARQAMQQERAFLLNVINSVPGFIFVKDQDGRFRLANAAVAEAYGVSVEELLGKSDADYNPNKDEVEQFREKDKLVIASGEPVVIPLERVTYHNGEVHWLSTIKIPLKDETGQYTRILGVCTDITARRQALSEVERLNMELEQRVEERSMQLREAMRDQHEFSYSVANALRAPLRALDGYARLLEQDCSEISKDDALVMLGYIQLNTLKMGQMIDDLLTFARFSNQPLRLCEVDHGVLVQEAIQRLSGEIGERQIIWTLNPMCPCFGDDDMLGEVWRQLLSNAIKFTRPTAQARIEVGCQCQNDVNVYFVRDNGVGFDMQEAANLFRLFERLPSAAEFEGMGTGLTIVQRIIQRHDGRIWAESLPGKGAAFYFQIGKVEK